MDLPGVLVEECVGRALREDLGESGDLTTRLALPVDRAGVARIVAKEDLVVAGLPIVEHAFAALDPNARITQRLGPDGTRARPGDVVIRVSGSVAALLAVERTALNFLQRLSGIATGTARYVDAVAGTGARIYDTRKTTPMLRRFEKYAVAVGGGTNHRIGLFDQVLLKENHFAWAGMPYRDVVERVAASLPPDAEPIVAEARNLDEARAAVEGGAGVVLLDNFEPGEPLREAVALVRETARASGRSVEVEASGGVTLESVRAFAECGVDRISIGALTHSARCVDYSMLVDLEGA
ncbi:MAG: carboxylating nicotinate-nucleotide diphosphorylase [Planctomycetes bacterium]|nr:carboxylating nicotinate-nucleotide diphosphorylase [Planctomycetota bacterium]